MCRGIKRHEDILTEEVADIELVGEDFPPGTYMSFTPTFMYLGTIISWDLREVKDVEARIKSANKLFGSVIATAPSICGRTLSLQSIRNMIKVNNRTWLASQPIFAYRDLATLLFDNAKEPCFASALGC